MSKNLFYTVWVGVEPGVYSSWSDCSVNVSGFSGAKFKSFSSFEEAEKAFNEGFVSQPTKDDLNAGRYSLPDLDKIVDKGGVIIYSDGSLIHGILGPEYDPKTDINIGGYGALLVHKNGTREISGSARRTTVSRMEMIACIEAIKCVKRKSNITIISDSGYLVNTINLDWNRNKNEDLWKELSGLMSKHDISFHWISGHAGFEGNEIADRLATNASGAIRAGLNEPQVDEDIDNPHLMNIG